MNYLNLINKSLVELNYKQVSTFSELTKNEHKKLKNILNIINCEICSSEKWDFLQRKTILQLPKNTSKLENIIEGRIEAILIDGCKLNYNSDYEKYFTKSQPANTYSFYNNQILLPLYNEDKELEILYYTKNCAKNNAGEEILKMDSEQDYPLIPEPFVEPLLVYGACMRLKGNPQHVRFSYCLSMYKEAVLNLRSRISPSIDETPTVKLFRR